MIRGTDTKESSFAGDNYYIENTKDSLYKLEWRIFGKFATYKVF